MHDWKESYIVFVLLMFSHSVYKKFLLKWNYQTCKWNTQHFPCGYWYLSDKIHENWTEGKFVLTFWQKLALLAGLVLCGKILQQVNVTLWLTVFFSAQTLPLFVPCRKKHKAQLLTHFMDLSLDKQNTHISFLYLWMMISQVYTPPNTFWETSFLLLQAFCNCIENSSFSQFPGLTSCYYSVLLLFIQSDKEMRTKMYHEIP